MRLFRSLVLPLIGLTLATPVLAAPVADVLQPAGQTAAYAAGITAAQSPAGPAVANGTNAAAGPMSTDEAKIALGIEIVGNMRFYDLAIIGGKKGINQTPELASWSQADRDLLCAYFAEEMEKYRTVTIRTLAAGAVDPYSMDQLNQLVALSRVKFIQDMVMYSADPTRPMPNAASMTPAEKTLVDGLMEKQWVADFMRSVDPALTSPALQQSIRGAFQRFAAAKGMK